MKITTKDFKSFISKWLNTDKAKFILLTVYFNTEHISKLNNEQLKSYQELFDKFSSSKNWFRQFKFKCDEYDLLHKPDIDGFNSPKIKDFNINHCIKRTFFNKSKPFFDDFIIEIITDPKDQIILYWNLSKI